MLILIASALLLAACGSGEPASNDGKAGASSAEPTASTVPVVTTPTEKICGEVDRGAVAAVFEVPEGKVVIFDGIAGEEMKRSDGTAILDKSGDPMLRNATICDITNKQGTEVFTLSFFDAKTSAEQTKSYSQDQKVRLATYEEEDGVGCKTLQDPAFGEPSWGEHCDGFDGGFGSLNLSGVFGSTVVSCTTFTDTVGEDLVATVKPVKTICSDALKAIAG
jgi:hypothetical protein